MPDMQISNDVVVFDDVVCGECRVITSTLPAISENPPVGSEATNCPLPISWTRQPCGMPKAAEPSLNR